LEQAQKKRFPRVKMILEAEKKEGSGKPHKKYADTSNRATKGVPRDRRKSGERKKKPYSRRTSDSKGYDEKPTLVHRA